MQDLLGDVPYPTFPRDMDFRDASDLVVGAVLSAAGKDPDRFFGVLEKSPKLLEVHNVVWALGSVKDERAIPLLLGVLRDGDSMQRWSAAHGLESRRDPRVVEGFTAAVGDRAPTVRAVVVEALGKIGGKSALAALREAAKKEVERQRRVPQKAHRTGHRQARSQTVSFRSFARVRGRFRRK